jgi:putative ABC transport system permease protein
MRLSGRFRSSLIIGGQGIRARKLRTFLSMISLFLGVLAVVVVQAGAVVAEHSLLAGSELSEGRDGTRKLYLPDNPQAGPIVLSTLRGRTDAVAVTRTTVSIGEPGVAAVNPGAGSFTEHGFGNGPPCDDQGHCAFPPGPDGRPKPPGKAIELQLTAMTGDIRQFQPFPLVSGRWLDFGGAPSLAPRIVLNTDAAKGFSENRVPAQLHVPGARADATPRITGVVDDGNGQPTAYVRADELQNWQPALFGPGAGAQVMMGPDTEQLGRLLITKLTAAGVNHGDLRIETVNARKSAERELSIMRWVFLSMAGLVLLIGVAGILNVGLATVGERIEEFALRRAVGTPRSLLAGIVLAETLLTGLLTAAAAIGVGAAAMQVGSMVLASRSPSLANVTFPWQAGVAGVTAGLIAGVLGGLIPAIRAARIPIATVMRA